MDRTTQYLIVKIDEELKNISGDMLLGKTKDFESYKYAVGIARGLMTVKGMLQEMHEQLEKEDE